MFIPIWSILIWTKVFKFGVKYFSLV